jgi:hypothetical protein
MAGIALPLSASADDNFINSSGTEANNTTSPVMVDLLILRPLGLLSLTFSTVFFMVPVLPITLLTRPTELGVPFKALIIEPARYVWVHRLGSH